LTENVQPKNKKGKEITKYFLHNLLSAFRTLTVFSRRPQELADCLGGFKERLSASLFRKSCLSLISVNFEFLFNFDRNNLISVLSLIAAENGKELWSEVIAKKYAANRSARSSETGSRSSRSSSISGAEPESISSDGAETETDNRNLFFVLVLDSFYE
jgi:hypothetical protein